MNEYYKDKEFCLYKGDCKEVMAKMPEDSVDLIFADPPYFLSEKKNDQKTDLFPAKEVWNYKGNWDVSQGIEKDYYFHLDWITEAFRVLKPGGTIWITGTHHNIYQCGFALQVLGFKVLNEISWFKPHSHYYSRRYFNFSHETIIWAKKDAESKHYFNYELMKQWEDDLNVRGEEMKTVWVINPPSGKELEVGRHPTQKPLALLRRIILASSKPGDVVLDPFNGGGTTGIACESIGSRKYIGIDMESEYLDLSVKRLKTLKLWQMKNKGLKVKVRTNVGGGEDNKR